MKPSDLPAAVRDQFAEDDDPLRGKLLAIAGRVAAGLAANAHLTACYCEQTPDWQGELADDAIRIARAVLHRVLTTRRAM